MHTNHRRKNRHHSRPSWSGSKAWRTREKRKIKAHERALMVHERYDDLPSKKSPLQCYSVRWHMAWY